MRRRLIAEANKLARELKKAQSPTMTNEAYRLWEICSSNDLSIGVLNAIKLYQKAGYSPFCGFPLQRKT